MQKNTNQKWLIIFFLVIKDMFKSLSLSLSLSSQFFNLSVLYWHDKKLYICIAKAIAAGLLTSSAHLN